MHFLAFQDWLTALESQNVNAIISDSGCDTIGMEVCDYAQYVPK